MNILSFSLFLVFVSSALAILGKYDAKQHLRAKVTRTQGILDNFVGGPEEPVFMAESLKMCSEFDWSKAHKDGHKSTMKTPYFDKAQRDSPLVWTISNLPKGVELADVTIELGIRGGGGKASNDGVGFLFDENLVPSGTCEVQVFEQFKEYTRNWGDASTAVVEIELDKVILIDGTNLLKKISVEGYVHILIGDDTIVDYMKFSYYTDHDVEELLSYTCNDYHTDGIVSVGEYVYSDVLNEKTQILDIKDSATRPFEATLRISTAYNDAHVRVSPFKARIVVATRFFLFVEEGAELEWVVEGGWELLTGAYVQLGGENPRIFPILGADTVLGKKFVVYTKKYQGPGWVVFGPPSDPEPSDTMYWISFQPTSNLPPVESNPAAVCDCSSTGDPHHVSFDNRRFDFYKAGTFHMVKSRDCTFDVQVYAYEYGSDVNVNGIVTVRYMDKVFSMSRTPQTRGTWTGEVDAWLNGSPCTDSVTDDTFVIVKITGGWTVSLVSVKLSVKVQIRSKWLDVHTQLGDAKYQLTVDGLCGNCDGDGNNDFLYPDCQKAISILQKASERISSSQVWRWGSSWMTKENEVLARHSLLAKNLGSQALEGCKANHLPESCPSVVVITPLDPLIEIIEPLIPEKWCGCNGGDIRSCEETIPPPEEPEVPEEPPCASKTPAEMQIIQDACRFCTQTTQYPYDDCLFDVCVGEIAVEELTCVTIEEECLKLDEPTHVHVEFGFKWATLGDGTIEGTNDDYCQETAFYLPPGWQVAPREESTLQVIREHNWESRCIAVGNGHSHETENYLAEDGACPAHGVLITSTNGCYQVKVCSARILIRRPLEPECGNGIVEDGEECDDGGLNEEMDGCSEDCKIDFGGNCDNNHVPSRCVTGTQEQEEPQHPCNLKGLPKECGGCVITTENEWMEHCCSCEMPCC